MICSSSESAVFGSVTRTAGGGSGAATRRVGAPACLDGGALEHAAPTRTAIRNTIPTRTLTMASPTLYDGRVYLFAYTPPGNISEVAVGRPSSVDGQDLAGDVRRGRRRQKDSHFAYFLGSADAAHGSPPGELRRVDDALGAQHGDELGLDIARGYGIDPHPAGGPLNGHDLGHHVEPGLGDAVREALGKGHGAVHAADVDDGPAASGQHARHDLLGQDEAAVEVEVQRVAIVGFGEALGGRDPRLPRIVDEDVHPAIEGVQRLLRQSPHL